MDAVVEWVDARERLQESEQDFWLVRPMYFTTRHVADDGTEYRDCFADSDRVVRLPYGRPGAEPVTHWAALPALPGMTVHLVLGEEARAALRNVLA